MSFRASEMSPLLPLIAVALVLSGALARVYDVDRMLVWHDEVFTLVRVFGFAGAEVDAFLFSGRDLRPEHLLAFQRAGDGQGWGDTLNSLREHPEHTPLYYLAARAAASSTESPVWAVRGTSAALSVLLLPAVFWLARELFQEKRVAWIAAVLVAWSPMHLLYAQEARQYAVWTVLCVAASAALLRALRTGRRRDWALYCLLIALGLYSHLLFVLALAAHAAYLLAELRGAGALKWESARRWGASTALALVLFSPWVWLVLVRSHRVEQVTAWMGRPAGTERVLGAWADNLVRTFLDVPALDAFLYLGLLPLAWLLWRFCVDAPRSPRLLLCLLFGAFAFAVLVPDLVQGGRRSLHPRYLLPAFIAVELAVAYVIASGWKRSDRARRLVIRAGFFVITAAGIWSAFLILRAETWWHKNFSGRNREVAAVVNTTERPLVLVSRSGVGPGEIISLAYGLDDRVVIRGESGRPADLDTSGFTDIFLLTPSAEARAALAASYALEPLLDTWQWFRAIPDQSGESGEWGPGGTAPAGGPPSAGTHGMPMLRPHTRGLPAEGPGE